MFFQQGLLLFLLAEAITLFLITGEIGFFKTFILLTCSAIAGGLLIQRQGLAMVLHVQKMAYREAVPVDTLFNGICMVIAGLLFILPGFVSDFLGILLLLPVVRNMIKGRGFIRTASGSSREGDIIEGAYVRVEEDMEQIVQYENNSERRDKT